MENTKQLVPPGKYHIPGYRGYISGIKSENHFGETYAKITRQIFNQNKDDKEKESRIIIIKI